MRDKEGSGFFGIDGFRDGTEYIHLSIVCGFDKCVT